MTMEKIYDIETGETTEIPLSKEKLANIAAFQKKFDAEQSLMNDKLQARQAVLNKLGLTDEEAKALLG